MNHEQIKSLLTTAIPVLGGFLVALGFISKDMLIYIQDNITGVIGAIFQAISAVTLVGGFLWKVWSNRTSAVVSAAASLPVGTDGAKAEIILPKSAPQTLVDNTPSNVTK